MKRLKQLSITRQFIIIILFAILFTLTMSVYVYLKLQSLSIENMKVFAKIEVNELNSKVVDLYSMVDATYNAIQFDDTILSMLERPYTSEFHSQVKMGNIKLTGLKTVNPEILDIALVSDEMVWSSYLRGEVMREINQRLLYEFKMVDNLGTLTNWEDEVVNTIRISPSTLLFARPIYDIYADRPGQKIGSLIISVDLDELIDNPYSDELENTFYLLSGDKEIIYPYMGDIDDGEVVEERVKEWVSDHNTHYIETDSHLIYTTYLPTIDIYTVSCFDTSYVNQDTASNTISMAVVIAGIFIVLMLLMIATLLLIVQPINTFYIYIQRVKNNDFLLPLENLEVRGCYEIDSINEIFSEIISEKEALSNELNEATIRMYEMELSKAKAELEFLNSQINPHFLYNTLEMIKNIAVESHVDEIPAITTSMAKLFRYSIKGDNCVAFSLELEVAKAYLDIQSTRYQEKFEIVYSIAETTLSVLVPKLILQPLVENAILHGLEPKTGDGVLFIASKLVEDKLIITVQDDGVGITKERLEEVRNSLKAINIKEDKEYIGILNVEKRIKLYYGNEAGITITSTLGKGTKITIEMPCKIIGDDICLEYY